MNNIPKYLIYTGFILIIIGLFWQLASRFFPLGKLPGDIIIKKENFVFYFPIMTSIVFSIVFSALIFIFRMLK